MPDELSGYSIVGRRDATAKDIWIRGASFRHGIIPHVQALAAELRVAAIEPTGRVEAGETQADVARTFAVDRATISRLLAHQ
jgi:hypothetical protein